MAPYIIPPNPRDLLPPLLACLPTAFASPQPPPSLLPLLSPILRQRLQFLTSSNASSKPNSWLILLCWDADQASQLPQIIENEGFEPHPVSGEVELPDVSPIQYRRVDEETLQARLVTSDLGLEAHFVWYNEAVIEGGGESLVGWFLAELKPMDQVGPEAQGTWCASITQANYQYDEQEQTASARLHPYFQVNGMPEIDRKNDANEDDDDYWARYDSTPGRTPAPNKETGSTPYEGPGKHGNGTDGTEADYYARYADTQPALDSHDPAEEANLNGTSTLNGNVLTAVMHSQSSHTNLADWTTSASSGEATDHRVEVRSPSLNHPRPASSSSTNSATVDKLENSVASQYQAEQAIQQHISTSMKSLYRLARSAGMERSEFERRIRLEIETFGMMDDD
ncbi:hypothetical protein MMC25_007784 [Agyrium rufum]|nr:hypothetical protein [Agyrium rufum]